MLEIKPCAGMAVISKQGRDKDKAYVIISALEKDFALVSDGNVRPLDKPKKKRIKHLKLTGVMFEDIKAKIEKTDKKKLYDTEIKRALKLWICGTAQPREKKPAAAKK